jgi:hypothetical protein
LKDGVPEGQGDGNLKGLFGLAPQHHVTLQILLSPGLKGSLYHFDPELTPEQVFSRFFGTANPYEALDGGSCSCSTRMIEDKILMHDSSITRFIQASESVLHFAALSNLFSV